LLLAGHHRHASARRPCSTSTPPTVHLLPIVHSACIPRSYRTLMAGHCRHASAFGSFSMPITNGCSVGCGRSWPVSTGMLAPYVLLCNTVPPLAATPAQQPPPLCTPSVLQSAPMLHDLSHRTQMAPCAPSLSPAPDCSAVSGVATTHVASLFLCHQRPSCFPSGTPDLSCALMRYRDNAVITTETGR